MELQDRVFIVTLFTLAMFVLFIEWRKRKACPTYILPPPPGRMLPSRMNIPHHRDADATLRPIAFLDMTKASDSGNYT